MSFPFTEEQQQLKDIVRDWFAQRYSLSEVRKVFEGQRAPLTVAEIAELGLEGSFAFGNSGASRGQLDAADLGLHELAIVAFECGYALAPTAIHLHLRGDIGHAANATEVGIPDGALSFGKEVGVGGESFQPIDRTQKISAIQDARGGLHSDQAALLAAECAGICARAIELTREYVTTRKQFGRAIGTFQAVQHKLADLFLLAETVRTTAEFAAWTHDHSAPQIALATAAARSLAHQHTATIVEGCIQLHGGIGFTWEHDLHLFLRRAKLLEGVLKPDSATRETLLAV